MANTRVVEDLVDVQFYTALDPYYYVVDNRPLQNLDTNIRLVAAASDAAAGGSNRSALGAAAAAYGILGFGQVVDAHQKGIGRFAGTYVVSGFQLNFGHGLMTVRVDNGGGYIEPALAIHDALTTQTLAAGRAWTIQARSRQSTVDDRIPSGDSPTLVAEISVKQSANLTPVAPDTDNIELMTVIIPPGATEILPEHITLVDMKTIEQTSNALGEAKIKYNVLESDLVSSTQNINLAGSAIVPTDIDAVEVFVQGVNQFGWNYNSTANQIVLESPLTDAAKVVVRQTVVV